MGWSVDVNEKYVFNENYKLATPLAAYLDGFCSYIKDANDDYVVMGDNETGSCMSEEDVSHIVRMVNAHDALVKAVEIGLRYAPEGIGSGRKTMMEALKLARGENEK